MIAGGFIHRKGKGGGFYRLNRLNGAKHKEAIDLSTGEYPPKPSAEAPELASAVKDLPSFLASSGKLARYDCGCWHRRCRMPRVSCPRQPARSMRSTRPRGPATTGAGGPLN